MTGDILVVPACGKGRGGGHLIRSMALVESLRRSGAAAFLHLPGKPSGKAPAGVPFPGGENLLIGEDEIPSRSWGLVVLDLFRTEKKELARWMSLGPVVAVDEGGCRDDFDFLIDLLPRSRKKSPPNILCPAFLPLPERSRPSFYEDRERSGPFRVLVSFGAEDPAGLTVPAALALAKEAGTACRITALFGPLYKNPEESAALSEAGVLAVRGNGNGAREMFSGYDLVLTHFGLGAFEALAAKVPVLLVSPGTYHETLAKKAGFVSAGTGKRGLRRLGSFLFSGGLPDEKKLRRIAGASRAAAARWLDTGPLDLGGFLLSWNPVVHRRCPACASERRRLLERFPDRTYRRCLDCGIVSMDRTTPPPQEYNAAYFFEDYKKQYGKTYLEDFPALKKNGKRRLGIIKTLLAENSRKAVPSGALPLRLLDVGCAYGPFLEAAGEEGFVPEGIDPAENAVRHVREKLAFQAFHGLFPDDFPGPAKTCNVVTFWFVIEHLEDPWAALAAANRLLAPGGVLAFSTPSFCGVSRRRSLRAFLENSPGDHWTIWDPGKCAALLSRCGFTLRKRVVTGHHPERFPRAGRLLTPGGRRFFLMVSRVFGLGDTFEVYAVKTGELSAENRDG
ncbi:MAG: methyltransferase domain-containing protein, partial [Treponema sp.]|jgi:2-polyprenyl-3-methyl-5-hydroxy-6-metoxy-1,4-benzoquinol methylase/spore coat polysaccharide biosynthesis predicted glycosyltransferase SpsG|nr:methyltransferase domain-containing protein [Treponema sp.]